MKRFLTLSFALLTTIHGVSWAQSPQSGLPRLKLQSGINLIDTQIAMTSEQREIGLMYRTQMQPNEGMLFIFEQPQKQCFWMKNTLLPLTAAFIDNSGTILNLADMQPNTTNPHCSTAPVRFVLEMHQGWFAKRGIKPGTKFTGSPFTP
jgi:uncharacterized protein